MEISTRTARRVALCWTFAAILLLPNGSPLRADEPEPPRRPSSAPS